MGQRRGVLNSAKHVDGGLIRNGPVAFQEVLRELKAENINGTKYLTLKQRKAQLKIDARKIDSLTNSIKEAFDRRDKLIKELAGVEDRRFAGLSAAAKIVNESLYPDVRVAMHERGDRRKLIEHLRTNTQGQLHKVEEVLVEADDVVPSEWRAVIDDGASAIEAKLGITEAQAQKLADMDLDSRLAIDELQLPATMEILLNLSRAPSPPVWRELEQLSTGQKATAVLLLLLLSSGDNGPLIIDQAEDDLDNAFIADVVVTRLRAEKPRRQFILSTHNPNIPVLGDAELVVRLSADGEAATGGTASIASDHVGSIDKASVRETLEALEGGSEAFDARRRRYRF